MLILLRWLLLSLLLALPARADTVQAMRTALDVAASGDWEGALAVAPAGIGRDVILWQALRAGEGRLGDYEDFLARRGDFPGLALLRQKGETAVARSDSPSRVLAWFGDSAPATAAGAIALVRALLAEGRVARAETEAMRAWAELDFSAVEEEALLSLQPEALALVHDLRLENLLWRGARAQAERMLPRVPADRQKLARARIALQQGADGVNAAVAAVPEALQRDPGLLHDRFIFRMKAQNYDGAAELVLPVAPEALGRPEAWADRRITLARWLMRQGRPAEAYRVAARHGLGPGGGGASDYATLEFLSGFIALRRLGDATAALEHFRHLEGSVSTPISLARAAYWQGRALEALGRDAEAKERYRAAARHQTAFYGLMAAERLGLTLDASLLATAPAGPGDGAFRASPVFDAAELLRAAGDRALARRFLLHLAESQDAAGLAAMADWALHEGEPNFAVLLGKAAAERGLILPAAYYPVTDMVPDGLKVSRALALAIARRESEFDPLARSSADARGLMQVLPETAKGVARDLGLDYAASKLTSDPAFNVTIGAAYLAGLVEEFGPSIALVASGYNAGPGRPRRWIGDFGDPRRADVDIVDWVESIPFEETRTYVMRVVEGVVIYRAKLRGEAGPVRITAELKG